MDGWACLDIGCGPRGITDLLSARVGRAGRVTGLNRDDAFLEYARRHAPDNVAFRRGDVCGSDLPAGSFDLVHMRFVASTAGSPERLLQEAARLARPGGIVALQEPDGAALHCYPPHPAWDR
jgi:ubiquinone/menaquinone biosynthesis C-methylase UbiE